MSGGSLKTCVEGGIDPPGRGDERDRMEGRGIERGGDRQERERWEFFFDVKGVKTLTSRNVPDFFHYRDRDRYIRQQTSTQKKIQDGWNRYVGLSFF